METPTILALSHEKDLTLVTCTGHDLTRQLLLCVSQHDGVPRLLIAMRTGNGMAYTLLVPTRLVTDLRTIVVDTNGTFSVVNEGLSAVSVVGTGFKHWPELAPEVEITVGVEKIVAFEMGETSLLVVVHTADLESTLTGLHQKY